MLKSISESRLHSPFILFVGQSTESPVSRTYACDPLHPLPDKTDHNGSSLFLSIVKSYIKSADCTTHVLCWERKTMRRLQEVKETCSSKLLIHDCLCDFQGWIDPDCQETGFISVLQRSMIDKSKEINVVIDSLSNPLFTIGFGHCLREIHQLINSSAADVPKIHQLLCFVHGDVVPCGPSSLSHLKHLASTVVELRNQIARVTHRKPGGHIERKDEKYSILQHDQISVQPCRTSATLDLLHLDDRSPTLPQDVASFRVSLSEKEREDRNKLVLPYMRITDNSEEKSSNKGGGKVFYQPDAVDDWDDEDPDDDLDI